MSAKLIGKKLGMMQVFSESGEAVPCTVIQIEPNLVTQVKTEGTDGYAAVQVASVPVKGKSLQTQQNRTKKPQREFFKKLGIAPQSKILEFRVEKPEEYTVGQALGVALFAAGQKIDITGTSIGKGFQGVIKKYGMSGGPAAHGSGFHRHAGSSGMRTTPGRCFKGSPRASHMGDKKVTVQNLEVVEVVEKQNLLLVKGAVPGARNGVVTITAAKKVKQ